MEQMRLPSRSSPNDLPSLLEATGPNIYVNAITLYYPRHSDMSHYSAQREKTTRLFRPVRTAGAFSPFRCPGPCPAVTANPDGIRHNPATPARTNLDSEGVAQ
ncbi:hypothetical protein DSM19430T_15150 [Desulfovibrio psychrotolerans]|uniref:Uncharacterized protein n=1 Tax=Desulfovibrio psychrotolerans TaxID=415242 RepID=A0A7J0BUJ0_9BACT|nr:hypothetical protein DSM19430T_15150 [Desulfovibrio psychrotolerans]